MTMTNYADLQLAKKYISKYKGAKNNGVPFDLSLNRVKEMIDKGVCEYTGEAFSGMHGTDPATMSIERIDPRIGYIDSNVIGVTHQANQIKGATLDLLMHDDRLSSEAKLKMLRRMEYRLAKTVKEEKAAKAAEKAEAERLAIEEAERRASQVQTVGLSSLIGATRELTASISRIPTRRGGTHVNRR